MVRFWIHLGDGFAGNHRADGGPLTPVTRAVVTDAGTWLPPRAGVGTVADDGYRDAARAAGASVQARRRGRQDRAAPRGTASAWGIANDR